MAKLHFIRKGENGQLMEEDKDNPNCLFVQFHGTMYHIHKDFIGNVREYLKMVERVSKEEFKKD